MYLAFTDLNSTPRKGARHGGASMDHQRANITWVLLHVKIFARSSTRLLIMPWYSIVDPTVTSSLRHQFCAPGAHGNARTQNLTI
jgi:hypothetical protein